MAGKPVVTANKELLANAGRELFETAEGAGVDLLFEASVAGGIPLIRPLRESLAGDRIRRVIGIVNGTTNYILTRMTEDGRVVRRRARRGPGLGYAERRPHGRRRRATTPRPRRRSSPRSRSAPRSSRATSYREGITDDHRRRHRVRPRPRATSSSSSPWPRRHDGEVAVRVHPAMVPGAPSAGRRCASRSTRVFIEGDAVGELMLYGRGAGGAPTASAVLGDLIDAAKNLVGGGARARRIGALSRAADPAASTSVESQFYLRMDVADRPGVLADIADAVRRARRVDQVDAAAAASATRPASSSSRTRARESRPARRPMHALRDVDVGAPRRLGAACRWATRT